MSDRTRRLQVGTYLGIATMVAVLVSIALSGRLANAASPLTVSPMSVSLPPRGTQMFTASGGSGMGYTWSLTAAPSGGTISATGAYMAGSTPNVTDQVQVMDSSLAVATATVIVGGAVTITPPGITLAPGNMQQFTGAGGTPPYAWMLASPTGSGPGASISAAGLYTAGAMVGMDTVRMTDSIGNTITATIDVVAMVPIGTACTTSGTCPMTSDGNPYCVDGVCCSSACTNQCQACNTANALGTCATIAGPPVGTRPACPMSNPNNVCSSLECDGHTPASCTVFVGPSTMCGAATCVDLVGTPAAVCQGDGGCQQVVTAGCAPFACVSDTCATSCTNSSECSPGNYCDVSTGKCVIPPGSPGSDAGTASTSAPPQSSSGCSVGSGSSGTAPIVALTGLLGILVRRRSRPRAVASRA
jgi:MYXO-CTERM domain-containing protein